MLAPIDFRLSDIRCAPALELADYGLMVLEIILLFLIFLNKAYNKFKTGTLIRVLQFLNDALIVL